MGVKAPILKKDIMKYRAKITAIQYWVENHYNTNNHSIVKDEKDTYIEVDSMEEAEHLEHLNTLRIEERREKLYIINNFDRWQ